MSYASPLVPLISVSVLYENNLKEQQALEQAVVTRWLTILTRDHIEEKIKAALKSGKQVAVLIDEQFECHLDINRVFKEPMIPYEKSIHHHIISLMENTAYLHVSCTEKDRHVLISVEWCNDEAVADCIGGTSCCFLFCLCCMCLGH